MTDFQMSSQALSLLHCKILLLWSPGPREEEQELLQQNVNQVLLLTPFPRWSWPPRVVLPGQHPDEVGAILIFFFFCHHHMGQTGAHSQVWLHLFHAFLYQCSSFCIFCSSSFNHDGLPQDLQQKSRYGTTTTTRHPPVPRIDKTCSRTAPPSFSLESPQHLMESSRIHNASPSLMELEIATTCRLVTKR